MVRAENLIVKSKCFIATRPDSKNILNLKDVITSLMVREGYKPKDPRALIFQDRFLATSFYVNLPYRKPPLNLRIKKVLGLISDEQLEGQVYIEALRRIRDDIPFKVSFSLIPSEIKDKKGILINIRSEPAILFKVRSLGLKLFSDELSYSVIVSTNKYFIEEIIRALGAIVIEEPRAVSEYIKIPVIDKLERFGFENVAELLKRGKIKIERGDTEDGLTDLREALNKLVSELVRKKGQKPTNKLPKDLKTLKEMRLLNEPMYTVVRRYLYDWIYSYLSAKPVHQRERIDYDDANFLFSISEEIVNYLIDKIILGR